MSLKTEIDDLFYKLHIELTRLLHGHPSIDTAITNAKQTIAPAVNQTEQSVPASNTNLAPGQK